MKKLLSMLLMTVMFISCGNEKEEDSIPDLTSYKVSFNVSNSLMDSRVSSTDVMQVWPDRAFCQYTIYKETGEAVKSGTVENIGNESVFITAELPNGGYRIAVLVAIGLSNRPVVESNNFNTDYCYGNRWILGNTDNEGMYFETLDFKVQGGNNDSPQNIKLKPMWSEINVEITDAATCVLPEGTVSVACAVDPCYYGFAIKDKIPVKKYDAMTVGMFTFFPGKSIDAFRKGESLRPATAGSESKDITVKLVFWNNGSASSLGFIVGEKILYKGNIEAGKRIDIAGKLGNSLEVDLSSSFVATVKDF